MRIFLRCSHCGNLVGFITDSGVPIICCGEPMTALKPNTIDASHEKHVPVLIRDGGILTVAVGAAPHPMTSEHCIEWIAVEQGAKMQRIKLTAESQPEAAFPVRDGAVTVYAYCNLHGLWSAKG